MMTILAEQPLMLSIMLGLIAAGLVYGYLQTGNKKLGLAGLLIGLMIPLAWAIAAQVVTDRELILAAIDETVVAIDSGDVQKAVQIISDSKVKQRAEQELPRYIIKNLRARNMQIRMLDGSYPPEAKVDLDASMRASMKSGGLQDMPVARRVILTFQKQADGKWMVTDYEHLSLTGNVDNFSQFK